MKKHHLKGKRGENHPKAKLDWDKVDYIRANPRIINRVLAAQFGVCRSTIWQVKNYITWRKNKGLEFSR